MQYKKIIEWVLQQSACQTLQGCRPDTDPSFPSRNLPNVSHLIVHMYLCQEKLEWLDTDMEIWTCLIDSMVCFYRRWITEQSSLNRCYRLYNPLSIPWRTIGNGEWKLAQTQPFITGKTATVYRCPQCRRPKLTPVCVCVCLYVYDFVLLTLWGHKSVFSHILVTCFHQSLPSNETNDVSWIQSASIRQMKMLHTESQEMSKCIMAPIFMNQYLFQRHHFWIWILTCKFSAHNRPKES